MPVAHGRVTFLGRMSGGVENWSTGFSTTPLTLKTEADLEALATTAQTAFETHVFGDSFLNGATPGDVTYTGVRVQDINALGVTARQVEVNFTSPPAGGSSSPQLPGECSIVVSLMTPLPGGRGRGRMYLYPFTVQAVAPSGRVLTTVQDALADGMQETIDIVNADPVGVSVGVASSVGGFVTAVTRIRVGNVWDSQRRRRDQQVEAYVLRDITI
jgi:hypothetical protein